MKLDSRIPSGPIEKKWDEHRFQMKLVNPANKRKYEVIVIGTGLAGGAVRPVGSKTVDVDHYQGFPVSPDGKWVAVVDDTGAFGLQAVDRGEWTPVPWLGRGTLPIRWTSDGRGLFVYRPDEVPARVMRVDLQKRTVQPWHSFAPPDITGVHIFPAVRLSADGRTCVYSYARFLTVLYRATGLK